METSLLQKLKAMKVLQQSKLFIKLVGWECLAILSFGENQHHSIDVNRAVTGVLYKYDFGINSILMVSASRWHSRICNHIPGLVQLVVHCEQLHLCRWLNEAQNQSCIDLHQLRILPVYKVCKVAFMEDVSNELIPN